MTKEETGAVNCYTGACSECGQVLAVVVAPFNEPDRLYEALKEQRRWVRDGLVAGSCLVRDVWEGRVALAHKPDCSKDRKRRTTRKGRQAAA